MTVIASVTEKWSERVLEVPLIYNRLRKDMVIADGAPTYVNLTLTGPLRQIEPLKADYFTVSVDLANYGPGEWELVPVVQGPNTNKFPDVTVTLQEQRILLTLLIPAPEATPTPVPTPESTPEPTAEPTANPEGTM